MEQGMLLLVTEIRFLPEFLLRSSGVVLQTIPPCAWSHVPPQLRDLGRTEIQDRAGPHRAQLS